MAQRADVKLYAPIQGQRCDVALYEPGNLFSGTQAKHKSPQAMGYIILWRERNILCSVSTFRTLGSMHTAQHFVMWRGFVCLYMGKQFNQTTYYDGRFPQHTLGTG